MVKSIQNLMLIKNTYIFQGVSEPFFTMLQMLWQNKYNLIFRGRWGVWWPRKKTDGWGYKNFECMDSFHENVLYIGKFVGFSRFVRSLSLSLYGILKYCRSPASPNEKMRTENYGLCKSKISSHLISQVTWMSTFTKDLEQFADKICLRRVKMWLQNSLHLHFFKESPIKIYTWSLL